MLERFDSLGFRLNRYRNPGGIESSLALLAVFLGGTGAVIKKLIAVYGTLLMIGASGLVFVQTTHAAGFNPMNMMNPSKWFGGRNRGYYDDYDRYGPGYGGYGPGYGGYGPGYGTYAPGYGAPGYGYAPAPAYAAPAQSAPESNDRSQEIRELQDRIERLERSQSPAPASVPPVDTGSRGYQQGGYPQGGYPGGSYQGSESQSFTPTYRPLGR